MQTGIVIQQKPAQPSTPIQGYGLDDFYPISQVMSNPDSLMWTLGWEIWVREYLRAAKNGSRSSESKLVNRLGQVRRCLPMLKGHQIEPLFLEAVAWLRTTGRIVDLSNADPGRWISTREGKPRF